ncbi:serine hydrolase domain-containing protein [Tuwongella immobilis]|uniref:Beta-lactamase-related domain-containing protein n=1 Tax=Tuwongella immobilis TaxID=692036 RepID=A0A6C2YRN9_9BACT|nr:serine hydrolase domain-containing protein [Tuwongella immobilis]VIP04027.1 Beta-lactamase OS=Rhodopirellula europaea SH398 GN=RESH_01866 PE=4 SV=1: Beta-lactamase [Tuwongella immobilis]VTS05421.1 Beta-lactamase OS=Rhodopirellula europaea SH398 GN=RESH_01866 PE=4 SV=1: Beta-lactamase [Tuwongella immobilis]
MQPTTRRDFWGQSAAALFALGTSARFQPATADDAPRETTRDAAAAGRQQLRVDCKRILEASIQAGEIPGAVLLVLHRQETILHEAYGNRAILPAREPMTTDTIFDLASLTKPIATATAVMQVWEQGLFQLNDPVAKHWPAFAASGKKEITIEQLLVHTSGLIADNPERDYRDGREKAFARIAALTPLNPPGMRFRYSDVNFLVLGDLVERLGRQPLDVWTRERIFQPLKMTDTGFRPDAKLIPRIAPTEPRNGMMVRGTVHDPRAALLGGVAGHAGLFGTAADLGRYARMLLGGGSLDGSRTLRAATLEQFLTARTVPMGKRALGWDVDTGFSAPRGDRFPKGRGIGHTGFTGTSIWIDPPSETAVILLASRLHPEGKGNATPIRKQIATRVADWALAQQK